METLNFKDQLKAGFSIFPVPTSFLPPPSGHVFGRGVFLHLNSSKSALHLCKTFMSGQLHLQIFDSRPLKFKSDISGRLQT